jgi:hypothetical protein
MTLHQETTMNQGYINHVAIIADRSLSMTPHRDNLIKVIDNQVAYLAQRSQELNQETRVTIYLFNHSVECLVYDKDVLRLPSIAGKVFPAGRTALMDATARGIGDLQQTAQLYGDHAFLVYVLTDGQENESHLITRPEQLSGILNGLPENWTVAALVPNQRGKFEAMKFGFPKGNVEVWDTTSSEGMIEVGETIRRATDDFMTARSRGVRGTRTVFSMDPGNLNSANLYKAGLRPLAAGDFHLFRVMAESQIKPFVEAHGVSYHLGIAYYQLTKTETIQGGKAIAVRNKRSGEVFTGQHARDLLGLPGDTVRVAPGYNPEYDVFVQSTSVNRKLVPNTDLLVLH